MPNPDRAALEAMKEQVLCCVIDNPSIDDVQISDALGLDAFDVSVVLRELENSHAVREWNAAQRGEG